MVVRGLRLRKGFCIAGACLFVVVDVGGFCIKS